MPNFRARALKPKPCLGFFGIESLKLSELPGTKGLVAIALSRFDRTGVQPTAEAMAATPSKPPIATAIIACGEKSPEKKPVRTASGRLARNCTPTTRFPPSFPNQRGQRNFRFLPIEFSISEILKIHNPVALLSAAHAFNPPLDSADRACWFCAVCPHSHKSFRQAVPPPYSCRRCLCT